MTKHTRMLIALLPLLIFIVLAYFLWRGLSLHPQELPSTFLNKPVPSFSVERLDNPKQMVTRSVFAGHVSLVNVWATWCVTCRVEHPFLMDIKRQYGQAIKIIGLDYKDERPAANQWLNTLGNPYDQVLFDASGRVAIDWGVYGTPETFIIDKKGVIRYKLIGAVNHEKWQQRLQPVLEKLLQEQG